MAKTSEIINLSFLLDNEKEIILGVLQKDENLRKLEEKRIRKLKNELLEIRRKGGTRRHKHQQQSERVCVRCQKSLGLIFDRGDVCEECQLRVCKECRVVLENSKWKCTICAKISKMQAWIPRVYYSHRGKSKDEKVNLKAQPDQNAQERSVTPTSTRSALRNVIDASRHRGLRAEKKGSRLTLGNGNNLDLKPEDSRSIGSASDLDAHSVHSTHSASCSARGGTVALESSGMQTIPNNLRSSAPGKSPTLSKRSAASGYSRREEDDLDRMMALNPPSSRGSLIGGLSTAVQSGSERKWSYLNVPDCDGETTSLNSMMSVYSETGDYGDVSISGEILLNITYSYKTGALNILVKECRNLAIAEERKQKTDPYVKVYLLPDKSRQSKRKTKLKANTTNPVYNETLKYVISHSQLETRTLQLSVWHYDRFGHNSFLGEVEIPFESWEFENQTEEWFALQPKVDSIADAVLQYKGELRVAMRYIPPKRNLTLPLEQFQAKKSFLKGKKGNIQLPTGGVVEVQIKEAKNLTAVKSGGTSDTFVKGYMLPDTSKSSKHKTPVVKKSVNPSWNHTFTYSGLQPNDLNNVCLELTVWDKESLSSNVFLGGVRLNIGTDTTKSSKHKTPVVKKSVNPSWNHTFTYSGLQPNDLNNVCLELTVWDKESLSSNVFLGGVRLNIGTGLSYGNEVDWMDSQGEEQRLWQRMLDHPEASVESTLMLRSSMGKRKL
ncbi:UNVERIFIED_CONTAM: hypothetical protein FKN15_057819 [Acipenser sinensis]